MRPRSIVAAVGALALLVAALWWLRGAPDKPVDDRSPVADASSSAAAPGALGFGGIPIRESDLSAAARVEGEVVDEDGAVVSEGTLHFACLRGDEVEAIPSAAVRLDEFGQFSAGTCRSKVCASFHHPYLVPEQPWVLRPGTEHTLVARRLARLWGRVEMADGEPAVAAKITFLPPEDSADDPTTLIPLASRVTTTDADGIFSVAWIERPPCGPCEAALDRCGEQPLPLHPTVRAVVVAPGAAPVTVVIDAEDPPGRGPDAPLTIALGGAADLLTGSVVDGADVPYPRAYVIARSVERPHEQRRAEVVDGNFEVDGLAEGRYRLRAIQDGVELAAGEASTGEDVELRGTLSATGPSLIVTVVDRADRPVGGATVDGGPFRAEKTDMKGQVRATNALSGKVAIRVRAPGAAARQEITVAEALGTTASIPVRIQLDR